MLRVEYLSFVIVVIFYGKANQLKCPWLTGSKGGGGIHMTAEYIWKYIDYVDQR
jgi:hypothetical protein